MADEHRPSDVLVVADAALALKKAPIPAGGSAADAACARVGWRGPAGPLRTSLAAGTAGPRLTRASRPHPASNATPRRISTTRNFAAHTCGCAGSREYR
ncbi:MAG: hypothetical protein MZW92_42735 [Comamonadaceae bacterium]|nr:hypothetical protein [Comamonadaceae bacterium]